MCVEKQMHTEFQQGKLKAWEHFEDLSVEGKNMKINLNEIRGGGAGFK